METHSCLILCSGEIIRRLRKSRQQKQFALQLFHMPKTLGWRAMFFKYHNLMTAICYGTSYVLDIHSTSVLEFQSQLFESDVGSTFFINILYFFLLFLVVVFDIAVACLHGLSWNKCYLGTWKNTDQIYVFISHDLQCKTCNLCRLFVIFYQRYFTNNQRSLSAYFTIKWPFCSQRVIVYI